MKDIRLDDHFKGLNNLKKGEKVIRTETPFKQNGWIYCVDSKRESYCFKRIKKVNIINLDRVELITYEGGIFYFQGNGAPYPKNAGKRWQAIDYIDFRGSKAAAECAFSCDKSFNNILEKIKEIHSVEIKELTFNFEIGDDFNTNTSFRKCYFPHHETTNLKTLDNLEANHWLFVEEGFAVGHLILDKFGRPIESSQPNEVTAIYVTDGYHYDNKI